MARKVIFVLDDDPDMLKGIDRLLTAHDFDVIVFNSANEFLDRANFSDGICLVLDIHLNGKSGIELRRQLTKSGVSLPVIFITGLDSESTRKAALEAGCIAYLPKPFPARLLIEAIQKGARDPVKTQ
jgi:FixJ family two-component response regulator